jgi:succinyl-CoA synthetase alpha subunit
MSILLTRESRVIVQGLTGREGSFHTEQMKAYGTNVVAGVSPGKGGTTHLGIPVFDTVAEARLETGADVTGIFVPAPFAADAIMEAAAAGVGLIVCITEGIPLYDMVRARAFAPDWPPRVRRRSASSPTTSPARDPSASSHAAGR